MINKVTLIGTLGRDPELAYANSGTAICKFSMATTEKVRKGDNWEDETMWHNVVVFGKVAENCSKFLEKGSKAYIDGKIKYGEYTNKEGNKVYKTDIIALNVKFLDSKKKSEKLRPEPQNEQLNKQMQMDDDDSQDDLPF